jgi:hypothetical protein
LHPGDGFQDFVRPWLIIRTHDNHTETVVVTFNLHAFGIVHVQVDIKGGRQLRRRVRRPACSQRMAMAQRLTQPAVHALRQPAVFSGAVVRLAGQGVINIKRNTHALLVEDVLYGVERWIPSHHWPPWYTGAGVSLRKNCAGSGALSSRNAAYFFLILGNSYKALTPCLAELRITEDGLK